VTTLSIEELSQNLSGAQMRCPWVQDWNGLLTSLCNLTLKKKKWTGQQEVAQEAAVSHKGSWDLGFVSVMVPVESGTNDRSYVVLGIPTRVLLVMCTVWEKCTPTSESSVVGSFPSVKAQSKTLRDFAESPYKVWEREGGGSLITEKKNWTGQQKHARKMNVLKETEGLVRILAVGQAVLHDGYSAIPVHEQRAARILCYQ
jgi:hypothetical protein